MDAKESLLRFTNAIVLSLFALVCAALPSFPAENLRLAPGISLDYDGDTVFPITGENLYDARVEPGKRNLVFFAATGDLNTNRQAKRLVDLSKKLTDTKIIIVNVDNPANQQARDLINKHYPGYVPAQLLIDREGKVTWSHIGECSRRRMKSGLDTAM